MTQITLTDEQTRLLASASSPIVIIDARGRKVAEVNAPLPSPREMTDQEWIAEAVRRRDEARRNGFTGGRSLQEILAELRAIHPE